MSPHYIFAPRTNFKADFFDFLDSGEGASDERCVYSYVRMERLTLIGPQSRFGDKLLIIYVPCPHAWDCGAKRVKVRRDVSKATALSCVCPRCLLVFLLLTGALYYSQ